MKIAHHFANNKILITGASGFLGSNLCHRLSQMNAEVHAISRSLHPQETHVRWWQGDMSDITTVRHILKTVKPDIIFHLASHGVGSPELAQVLPNLHNDLVATVNLLTVATELGCQRVVLTGSPEEPQPNNKGEFVPVSPYAAAKLASSAYGRMFHTIYQTPVVITKAFMTYGPRQRVHKLIPYVTTSLLQKQAPKLSSGQRQVDWIYVDDLIDGLLAAAHMPGIEGETIELGTGKLTSIRTIVEMISCIVNSGVEPLFGTLPDRPMEREWAADTQVAYEKLKWQATTPLFKGLTSTVNWYRQQIEDVTEKIPV
ncbi:MAG: NAD(P)-dependent oxidoreductase [Nostocaceae cyanobacterium]|nr:NAD(P)-dependent oxidoreductase [Nostocaceae cyanobacterium]